MNTINCPIVVKMSQNAELLHSHDIEMSLNSIIYDLKPELYSVEVKQSSQLPECRGLEKASFEFDGKDEEVCVAFHFRTPCSCYNRSIYY